jgi:hypothetical protein
MPREWKISWDYRVIGAAENLALMRQRAEGADKL